MDNLFHELESAVISLRTENINPEEIWQALKPCTVELVKNLGSVSTIVGYNGVNMNSEMNRKNQE